VKLVLILALDSPLAASWGHSPTCPTDRAAEARETKASVLGESWLM